MNRRLTPADFPLRAIGALVYAKTQSSPILTAASDAIAADLCHRLNYADICNFDGDQDGADQYIANRVNAFAADVDAFGASLRLQRDMFGISPLRAEGD